MTQGKILHLFGWDRKFVPSFIELIRKNFSFDNHAFAIYGAMDPNERVSMAQDAIHFNLLRDFFALSKELNKAQKIILHGLFNNHLFYILFSQPWLLRKCYWVIWGGDLYVHEAKGAGWRWAKDEFLRRFIIKRIGYLLTYVAGDVSLARQWYGAKGQHIECLMYPSNVFTPVNLSEMKGAKNSVLVGNSADPSNNHLEIFSTLYQLKNQNFMLICPLSYGDKMNAEIVVAEGTRLFGDRFVPLRDFMPYQNYLEMLGEIDIAVFAHRRQQGMGNAITLLGMGKKVFMRPDVTPWTFFDQSNVKVFDVTKDLCDAQFTPLDMSIRRENRRKIVEFFSDEKLKSQLALVFSGRGLKE